METKLMEALLVAIIAGLFGLAPVIIEKVTNRARRGSSARKLSSLFENLNFLEKWTTISREHQLNGQTEQGSAASERIQSDLAHILFQYQALKAKEAEQQKRELQEISFIRRISLLFLPHSAKGWIYHTLFYVLVIFTLTMVLTEFLVEPRVLSNEDLLVFMAVISLPTILLARKANQDRHRYIEQELAESA